MPIAPRDTTVTTSRANTDVPGDEDALTIQAPLAPATCRCDVCGSTVDADTVHTDDAQPGFRLCAFCFGTDLGHTIKAGTPEAAATATSIAQAMNLFLRILHDRPIQKYKP